MYAFDSRDQRSLGPCDSPAIGCDKGRIVEARVQETKGLIKCAGSYSQRELLGRAKSKRRYRGGDAHVRAGHRLATMDVRRRIGRGQPANDAMIRIVSAVVSRTTAAEPIPGEPVGGTSFEPVRIPPKVSVSARADGVGSMRAAATIANAIYRISTPPKLE